MDVDTVRASTRKIGRVVVVDEAPALSPPKKP